VDEADKKKPRAIVDRKGQWVGKPLSALLQILRAAGVTRYQTPELTLDLGPAPVKHAARGPIKLDLSPQALDDERIGAEEPDDEGDPRFLLERLQPRWFPDRKATPRKNKAAQ
jgi:hypothetical protein